MGHLWYTEREGRGWIKGMVASEPSRPMGRHSTPTCRPAEAPQLAQVSVEPFIVTGPSSVSWVRRPAAGLPTCLIFAL